MPEALRENEAKFRASFDQAPIGAAIVSLDYRFQRVNDELCRLTGYSAAELTSRNFLDITHPEDMAASIKQWCPGREEIDSISWISAISAGRRDVWCPCRSW